ncbi:MAG: alpha/beta hydrolase [Proteobacteria bacterium]|nr:alpha/beta hydrolase [Pseudomonadota bacterium]
MLDWYAEYDAEEPLSYLDEEGSLETVTYNGTDYEVLRDAHYGPHGERTSMDVFLPPTGPTAAPVVMFIHGGGFRAKDKTDIGGRESVVVGYLEQGIAVASINYRFRSDGGSETVVEPAWDCKGTAADNDGCRLDVIYRDGARAVQYLRYRSEDLNLDPTRMAAWGRSAGSQIATWVALVPDLAVADHPDPVLRESTRLQVVGHTNSQVTGPSHLWPDLVEIQPADASSTCDNVALWMRLGEEEPTGYNDALQSYVDDLYDSPGGQDLLRIVDFLELLDADAPPFITTSPVRDHTCEQLTAMSDDELRGNLVHHPRHGEPLYQRCLDENGPSECAIVTDVQDSFTGEETLVLSEDEAHAAEFIAGWLLTEG